MRLAGGCCIVLHVTAAFGLAQSTEKGELYAEFARSLPRDGAVVVTYESSSGQRVVVGHDFRSKAWFYCSVFPEIATAQSTFIGQDASGRMFGGEASPGKGSYNEPSFLQLDAALDSFFPSLFVTALLDDANTTVEVASHVPIVWRLNARLVGGTRVQPITSYSNEQLAAMGGRDRVLKSVTLNLDSELAVRSMIVDGKEWGDCGVAVGSRRGFQIAQTPLPHQALTAVKCDWINDASGMFAMKSVEERAVRLRLAQANQRVPVAQAGLTEPDPLQTTSASVFGSSLRTGIVLAGTVMFIIGAFAWLRRRGTA